MPVICFKPSPVTRRCFSEVQLGQRHQHSSVLRSRVGDARLARLRDLREQPELGQQVREAFVRDPRVVQAERQ